MRKTWHVQFRLGDWEDWSALVDNADLRKAVRFSTRRAALREAKDLESRGWIARIVEDK